MNRFALLMLSAFLCSFVSASSVTLEWDPPVPATNLAGYYLYRGDSAGGPYARVNPEMIPAGTHSYTDTTVVGEICGRSYYYVATALYECIGQPILESGHSNEAVAVVTAPLAPPILKTPRVTGANVDLYWDYPRVAEQFRIWRIRNSETSLTAMTPNLSIRLKVAKGGTGFEITARACGQESQPSERKWVWR